MIKHIIYKNRKEFIEFVKANNNIEGIILGTKAFKGLKATECAKAMRYARYLTDFGVLPSGFTALGNLCYKFRKVK